MVYLDPKSSEAKKAMEWARAFLAAKFTGDDADEAQKMLNELLNSGDLDQIGFSLLSLRLLAVAGIVGISETTRADPLEILPRLYQLMEEQGMTY